MQHKSFQEMGIPPGYGFKLSLFSPIANTIIVQTRSAANNWRPERLYFRHIEADNYRPISQPDALVSQEYPFVHPSKPLVAYNCLKHRFSVDSQGEERHGADWDSLNLFNLETESEVVQINQHTLNLPPGIVNGWISELVSFTDRGLFVTAGLSKDGTSMDYVIAELDIVKHILKPIAALPAAFM